MSTEPAHIADYVADEVLAQCEQTDEGWLHPCGTILLAARVHHTVYNSPIPLAGDGSVQVQTVPYCPTCHEKPSNFGAPITLHMTAWPVVKIKRRPSTSTGARAMPDPHKAVMKLVEEDEEVYEISHVEGLESALQACWNEYHELMPDALYEQVKKALDIKVFEAKVGEHIDGLDGAGTMGL